MVQPLNPIGPGPSGQVPQQALRASRPDDILRADSTRGAVQGGTAASENQSAPPLMDVLTQLFETLGLDAKNNQALQMLIALLILMAILETLQEASGNGDNAAMSQIEPPEGGQGYSAFYSSTTISFEQTSTTIYFGDAALGAEAFGADQDTPLGDNIDLQA